MFTRTLRVFAVLLGALGVVVCLVGGVVAWSTGARLNQVNNRVFDRIDASLAAARLRVLDTQKRVRALTITTQDLRQGAEEWARREAKERVASRPEVESKVERLAEGLQQTDVWLEMSVTSLQSAQLALETAHSLGAAADPTVVDPWLERLGAVRGQLKQSTETLDGVRERLARAAEGETLEERLTRLTQLALRIVATLGDVEARLGQVADGFVATQARGQEAKTRTHRHIVTAQLCAIVFMAWMALGQVFLARARM